MLVASRPIHVESLFLFSVLPSLKGSMVPVGRIYQKSSDSDYKLRSGTWQLDDRNSLGNKASRQQDFMPLRMQGGSSAPMVATPPSSAPTLQSKGPAPPGIPGGEGIRRDANGRLWAGQHVLLEKLDAKTIGLDMSDHRGVFLRSYAMSGESTEHEHLGKLQCSAFLAGARQKLWWMVPSWGKSTEDIPNETQFLLVRMSEPLSDQTRRDDDTESQETFALILSMVSGPYRSSFRKSKSENSDLVLTVESGDDDVPINNPVDVAYISTGSDPYKLLEEGFAAVSDRVKTFRVRSMKTLPPTVDYFGWCTWDAFYCEVSGPKIEHGLDTLKAGGVPAKFLIIDDGWQVCVPARHCMRTCPLLPLFM
jgi:hypothetical protein